MAMDTEANKAVGRSLRGFRHEAGLTQIDLAARLDKPQSYVSKIESGERSLRLYELRAYAAALGLSPEEVARAIFASDDLC